MDRVKSFDRWRFGNRGRHRLSPGRGSSAWLVGVCMAACAWSGTLADDRDAAWLAGVSPIMTSEELETFRSLTGELERRAFAAAFWKARDPDAATDDNEARRLWERRVAAAQARFGELGGERAGLYLRAGPPRQVMPIECPQLLRPIEIWGYPPPNGGDLDRTVVFVRRRLGAADAFSAWRPSSPVTALLVWERAAGLRPAGVLAAVEEECAAGGEARALLEAAVAPESLGLSATIGTPAAAWLEGFLAASTEPQPGDAVFSAEPLVRVGGANGSRRVVEISLETPSAGSERQGRYPLRLVGRVAAEGEWLESFSYDFWPAGKRLGRIAFERHLPPGRHRLALRLAAADGRPGLGGEYEIDVLPLGVSERVPPSVGLLVPQAGPVVGLARVTASVESEKSARLDFELDGRVVMSRRDGPFEVELDFGPVLRLHRVTVVARDARGLELARDSALVNAGPELSEVGVRCAPAARGEVPDRVRIMLRGPAQRRPDRVELYADQRPLAVVRQAPWVHVVAPGVDRGPWLLTAVVHFEDGWEASGLAVCGSRNDVSHLRTARVVAEVRDGRGEPVGDLEPEDLVVLEDGEPRSATRVEAGSMRPLHLALVVDPATLGVLGAGVWRRALRLLDAELGEMKERMLVVSAGEPPRLEAAWKPVPEVVESIEASLAGRSGSAVGAGLTAALGRLAGLSGQRAIILVAPLVDGGPRWEVEAVRRLALQAGCVVYELAVAPSPGGARPRAAGLGLAPATGGQRWEVTSSAGLEEALRRIAVGLRSRLLVSFVSFVSSGTSAEISLRPRRGGTSVILTTHDAP